MAKLCRSVCGDTRLVIPAAWAAARTTRPSWRADSGSTGLRPGNSQPPGSSRLRRRPSRHQARSSSSSCGDSIAWRSPAFACVDGPRLARRNCDGCARSRLRSCVRPLWCGRMTAGPGGNRKVGVLDQALGIKVPCPRQVFPALSVDDRHPYAPSPWQVPRCDPAGPLRRRPARAGSRFRAPSRPRRRAPSCWRARPQPPGAV